MFLLVLQLDSKPWNVGKKEKVELSEALLYNVRLKITGTVLSIPFRRDSEKGGCVKILAYGVTTV